jgi:hypothetical protein
MLPTGQTTGDRGACPYDLFGERRVHFYAPKKAHFHRFVNGFMKTIFAIV